MKKSKKLEKWEDPVKNDLIDTYFADVRKRFKRRRYVLKGINDLMQLDLLDLNKYTEFNDGYRYVLTAINCFSKFAYGEPLKTKTGNEITEATKKIFKRVFPMIRNIQVDQGTEFYNAKFKALMKEHNINMYSVYTEIKASFIERFHRTIRKLLVKEIYKRSSSRWIDFLQEIIDRYNNTVHSTIKLKPSQVSFFNEVDILRRLSPKKSKKQKEPKFKVGDYVHISKSKHIFEKSTFNFTPLVFQIDKVVLEDDPVTYRLKETEGKMEPILGTFYEEELKKAIHGPTYVIEEVLKEKKIRKKPYVYVKWLGFDDEKYNSWIPKTNLKS
jgi:hypothetical protein